MKMGNVGYVIGVEKKQTRQSFTTTAESIAEFVLTICLLKDYQIDNVIASLSLLFQKQLDSSHTREFEFVTQEAGSQ